MFTELFGQIPSSAPTVPVGDLVSSWTTSITGLLVALGTLGGLILAFIQTHTHSPRIAAAETDIEHLKADAAQIQQAQPQIAQAASVITQVVPGLQTAANSHETEIAIIKKQIDDLTAKMNLLTTIVPTGTGTGTPAKQ